MAVTNNIATSAFLDVFGWWRADEFTGSSPNVVLTDKSTNGRNMTQVAGTMTAGTAANGQAKFAATSARLTSAATLRSWPVTIITIGKRSNGATVGFFGHQGGTGYDTMWFGYEGSNSQNIYANNSAANTTTEYGADACYVARIGHGSRVPITNGIILADQTLSVAARSSAIAITIGTEYRNLNMDWYETLVWDRTLSIDELDEVHAYVNTRYGMSIPIWSSYAEVKEIGFGGQSNSDGRGLRGVGDANIPIAYRGLFSNVFVWKTATVAYPNMDLSTDTVFDSSYIGHQLTGGKDYADLIGEDVYVQKIALGSTSMSYTASGNNGYWTNIHDSSAQSDSRSMFSFTMREFWKSMRVHQQAGRKPVMVGYVFYQGEDDATDATMAANWNSLATAMFNAIRSEMGLGNVKIFLVRISINIDIGFQPYRDTVRTQQDNCAAALSNCVEISTDSYTVYDTAHIDYAGQLALGSSLATQF